MLSSSIVQRTFSLVMVRIAKYGPFFNLDLQYLMICLICLFLDNAIYLKLYLQVAHAKMIINSSSFIALPH